MGSDPMIENGILVFKKYSDVKTHLDRLYSNDNDSDIKEQMQLALGLTSAKRSGGQFYSLYPASQLFDQQNSFVSLRQEIENHKISELNKGNENIFSIISRPYHKSILNTERAVKVGDRIYIHFDSGLIALVANNDLNAYQYVISTSEELLSNRFNVRLFHKNYSEEYLQEGINGDYSDILVQDLLIEEVEDVNGNISLVNRSMVELPNDEQALFEWTFSDGTIETSNNPTKILLPNETYDVIAKAPPTGGGGGWTAGPVSGPRFCILASGYNYYTKLSNNRYRFTDPFYDPEKHDEIKWKISCDNFESSDISFIEEICCVGEVEVEMCVHKYYGGSDSWCCGTFTIEIEPAECNDTGESKDKQEVTFSNGETWEIDCLGWVETSGFFDPSTPGEVGARTRAKRRKPNGGFESAEPDFGIAGVTGQYADKDEDCAVYDIDVTSTNANDQNSQANHTHDGARLIKSDCDDLSKIYSRHGLTVDGETLYYTKNGGKLWIQKD
jgi:hypothetical protein